MDFKAELLARLQAGESADSLASELTKAINEANKENERIRQEAETKRKAEEEALFKSRELARNKAEAVDNLLVALEDIIVVWGLGDDLIEVIEHINPDDLVQKMDKIKDMMDKYEELFAVAARDGRVEKPKNALDEFLNKYVR